jgi:hypothetical protein
VTLPIRPLDNAVLNFSLGLLCCGILLAGKHVMSNTGWAATQRKMALVSVLSLFVMSYVDYITGYELVFSAAYLIPVSLCAWYFGRRSVVFMSAASGVAAFVVDAIDGHSYSHFMVQ